MRLGGWAQIALVLALSVAAAVPLGRYLAAVLDGRAHWLAPVERLFHGAAGIDPARGQGWRFYTVAMLAANAAGSVLLYALLRLQGALPFNPAGVSSMSPWLAYNTAVSFVTNTDRQAYSGEVAASYLSRMAGFAVQNFLSAATGVALAAAQSRAFAAGGSQDLGNFWADFVRATLYVLLPPTLAVGFALVALVALGVPRMLGGYVSAATLEGAEQTIAAFGGLAADTPWLNATLGVAMLLGRFATIVPMMAIAGPLAVNRLPCRGPRSTRSASSTRRGRSAIR